MARIGFIGLGNMGLPMAQNLIKAGHQVEGVDVNPASVEKLKAAGGVGVETAKSAAARADVVITMLPSGKEVREVYLGSARHYRERQSRHAADRLLDHRCRYRARGCSRSGEERTPDARRAGVGRRRRRHRRHAHLHGRRQRAGFHARRIDFAEDGQDDRACRRRRQRPGGQDLQQHDPWRVDDRGQSKPSCSPKNLASITKSCSTFPRSRPASAGR